MDYKFQYSRQFFALAFFLGLVGGVAKAGPIKGKLVAFLGFVSLSSFAIHLWGDDY